MRRILTMAVLSVLLVAGGALGAQISGTELPFERAPAEGWELTEDHEAGVYSLRHTWTSARVDFQLGSAFEGTLYVCNTSDADADGDDSVDAAAGCQTVLSLSADAESTVSTGKRWYVLDIDTAETSGNTSRLTIRGSNEQVKLDGLEGSADFLVANVDGVSNVSNPNDVDGDGIILEDAADTLDCNNEDGACLFQGSDGSLFTFDGSRWRRTEEEVVLKFVLSPDADWATVASTSTCLRWDNHLGIHPSSIQSCTSSAATQLQNTRAFYLTTLAAASITGMSGTDACKFVLYDISGAAVLATLNVPASATTVAEDEVVSVAVASVLQAGNQYGIQIGNGDFAPNGGTPVCPASGVWIVVELRGVNLGA